MNIYRSKLLNAVLFFSSNTKRVNLGKLSKLLYFLDFMHFREMGYPSIGLEYYTFERGPVPRDFWIEIRDAKVPQDFKGKIGLIRRTDDFAPSYKEVEVHALEKPDLSVFTPREIKILEKLAFIYKDASASDMSEVTHLSKEPWDMTIKKKGRNKPIDYLLSIDEKSPVLDDAADSLKEHFEVVHNFGIEPTK